MRHVKLEMSDWSMGGQNMKDVWKCVSADDGVLFVMTSGTSRMLKLFAGSWDSH